MFNVFYLDEFDKELMIAEKAYEIEMAEASFMEAMIDTRWKIDLAKMEYRVMTEGTADNAEGDLAFYFNEATKEAEASKESVFTKIKNALVSFFVSLGNSIQKIFTGKDSEAYKKLKASNRTITLPFNKGLIKTADDVVTQCENAAKNKKLKIVAIVGSLLGIGATAVGAKSLFDKHREKKQGESQVTESEACKLLEQSQSTIQRITALIPKIGIGTKDNGTENSTALATTDSNKNTALATTDSNKNTAHGTTNSNSTNDESDNGKDTLGIIEGLKGFLSKSVSAIKNALHLGKSSEVEDSSQGWTDPKDLRRRRAKGLTSKLFQKQRMAKQQKKDEKKYGKGTLTKGSGFTGLNEEDQNMFSSTYDDITGDMFID